MPVCLPFLLASVFSLTLDLECTATGFLITRPSLMSLRMFCLELAFAISLISLGSSQTLLRPHFITEAARTAVPVCTQELAEQVLPGLTERFLPHEARWDTRRANGGLRRLDALVRRGWRGLEQWASCLAETDLSLWTCESDP